VVEVLQLRSVRRDDGGLDADEAAVFAVDIDSADPGACWPLLDPNEIARARRFVRDVDRRTFVVARAGLRNVLSSVTAIEPQRFQFGVGSWGKPFITFPQLPYDLNFSVAHSDRHALIGVARDRHIGVDLERRRHVEDWSKIAAATFGAAWADRLAALDDDRRTRLFLRCWTVAEAYAKATGLGLAGLGGVVGLEPGSDGCDDVALANDALAQAGREWSITHLDLGAEYVASMVLETDSARPAVAALSIFHEQSSALQ
jgi:phosphopantetheinyl transferase